LYTFFLAANAEPTKLFGSKSPKNINFNATDIAIIKNDRLYVIQYYYTPPPKHQSYLPILQKMVDSFQIR
jgi:hypothetical protein